MRLIFRTALLAASALMATPLLAQTSPTVRVPECLQFPDQGTLVPCTGVVPVDNVTGNAMSWHDALSGTSTAGAASGSATPVQNTDGSKIATDSNVTNVVNGLSTVNSTLGGLFPKNGYIGNTSFGATQSGSWSVGLTGNLPAFAATPTFNLGTAPTLVVQGVAGGVPQPVSGNVTTNLTQINGSTISLGQTTKANSFPVTLASDGAGASIGNTTDAKSVATDGTAASLVALAKGQIDRQQAIITTLNAPMQQTGGSVSVTNFPATQPVSVAQTISVNHSQINGTAVATGTGASSAGTQRVVLSSDSTATVTGNVTTNITQVGGSTISLGQTTKANSFPVTLASDGAGASIGNTTDPKSVATDGTATSLVALAKGQIDRQQAIITTLNSPMQQTGGSLSVTNFPATQTVAGTINVGNPGGVSYTLLNGGTTTGSQTIAPGGYAINFPPSFNGSTITITSVANNGTSTSVSYTSQPASLQTFNTFAGTTISASVSGGTPTGNTTIAGGPSFLTNTSMGSVSVVDTVIKSGPTNRSAVIGFTATASAATSSSTSLGVVTTSNFTNQNGALSGIPMVGQLVSGTGITAGTYITAVTANSATSYTLTLSLSATVANAAAVTSVGPQLVFAANGTRRGFSVQNQNQTGANNCYFNATGVATTDANSMQIAGQAYFESKDSQVAVGGISMMCTAPSTSVYGREW